MFSIPKDFFEIRLGTKTHRSTSLNSEKSLDDDAIFTVIDWIGDGSNLETYTFDSWFQLNL